MIEVAIEKRLGSFSLDASFSAGSGVTALFGRSGSGKSTIVKAIAGLVRPDRGRIRVGDRVLFDAGTDLPAERRRAGVVFQDGRLFPHMSVEDNLMYGYVRADGSRPIDKAAVVDVLGLAALLTRRPQTLSGGERQRVAIGRALLAQPSVLLMDEPLASLDDARKREVLPYLGGLNERFRIPIIYVTHDADEVLSLANDLVLLANGRVVASGTLGDVTSRLDLPAEAEVLGLGAVLGGRIEAHDPSRGLTTIATAAGALRLPLMAREAGAHVAVRIAARDVAISLAPVDGISVQNILPVTVGEIAQPSAHVARLALKAGAATVLAEITNDARVRLGLAPGTKAFAFIKSVALARHS